MVRALRSSLLALMLLAGLGLIGPVAANPFEGRAAPSGEKPSDRLAEAQRATGPLAALGHAFLTFQRETNRLIAQHMRAIREGEGSLPLVIGAGLAFLYGVLHALGPGHGKLVVVSYFLSREARIGRGLLMGLQIAVFHVISAIVVVALADLLLRRAFGGAPAEVAGVRLFSYGLIASIGAVMLAQAIRRSEQRSAGIVVADGCCGGHVGHDHRPAGAAREQMQQGGLSLGVGLVPCTGAVLILLYAVANDMLFAGVLLAAAIAAGMAITMGGLGIVAVIARQAVASRIEPRAEGGRLAAVSDYGGALAIMAIGAGLFWAAL
jgi:ABC-type nickel/cobalt efflux system permease component RcnA